MSLLKATNLTIRNLQYILAVAETCSFTRAAALCNVTQPTLSSGIKDCEDQLSQHLFDRSRRKVSLTAFGQQILPDIIEILRTSNGIITQSKSVQGDYAGPLRFGIIPTLAPYILPILLPALKQSFPKLDLILNESMSQNLIDLLNNGDIDAAMLAFPYDIGDLNKRLLFDEYFYYLRPQTQTTPAFLKTNEIDTQSVLLLDDGHCLRDHALNLCDKAKPSRSNNLRATSLITLIQMVNHGYGTTLLPAMAVHELTLPDNLEAIKVEDKDAKRQIGLVWPSYSPLEKTIKKMIDTILDIEKIEQIRQ